MVFILSTVTKFNDHYSNNRRNVERLMLHLESIGERRASDGMTIDNESK